MKILKNSPIFGVVLLIMAACVFAQQPPPIAVNGSISTGGRRVENGSNSSKLTEYRDLNDDAILPRFSLNVFDLNTGRFFDFTGRNVILDDQSLALRGGVLRSWTLDMNWKGIPHNFSNKGQTPYVRKGAGLLEVPANVPITFKKLATSAADAPGVLASDQVIAGYQTAFLQPTTLRTQSGIGHMALQYSGLEAIKFGVAYDRQKKEGLKSSFGPIGDRPPRTLTYSSPSP